MKPAKKERPKTPQKAKACQTEKLWKVSDMLKAYARARIWGYGAPEEVVAKRRASCESCPSFCRSGGREWCGACGCGSNREEAMISGGSGPSKLTFLKLDCPRKRPGFTNEEKTNG